jgi:hypothetical protein
MTKPKLSPAQKEALKNWRQYPDAILMNLRSGRFLTGGHGIEIDGRTANSFERIGISKSGKLTDLGKSIEL